MAESVYAADLKSASRKRMRVQISLRAPQGVEQLECSHRLERGGHWFKSNRPDQKGGFMLKYNKYLRKIIKPYEYPLKEISEQDTVEDEIIYGLEYYAKFGKDYTNTKKSEKASKKLKHSLYLISKYYESFWW